MRLPDFEGRRLSDTEIAANNERILLEMTRPSSWDSKRFSEVMVALSILGDGAFIPARNSPESIHLQSLRPFFDDLLKRTRDTGREYARIILADKEKKTLVMSGKITTGSSSEVRLNTTKQPGRENFQKVIGSIHTHPDKEGFAYGLSDQDYRYFMSDLEQQVMLIGYGISSLIMVMKTSATPHHLQQATINEMIEDCREEFLRGYSPQGLVGFNKEICTQLALTMYMASEKSRDLFNRIRVAT